MDLKYSKSKSKKISIGFLCVVCFLLSGCSNNDLQTKYKQQLKSVHSLIEAFVKNDTIAVKKLIGVDLNYIGMNDEILAFHVNQMYGYLQKNHFEEEKDYEFKEYPADSPQLVDITIEFKKPIQGTEKLSLIISFVKYLREDKIANFRIIDLQPPGSLTAPDQ